MSVLWMDWHYKWISRQKAVWKFYHLELQVLHLSNFAKLHFLSKLCMLLQVPKVFKNLPRNLHLFIGGSIRSSFRMMQKNDPSLTNNPTLQFGYIQRFDTFVLRENNTINFTTDFLAGWTSNLASDFWIILDHSPPWGTLLAAKSGPDYFIQSGVENKTCLSAKNCLPFSSRIYLTTLLLQCLNI